MANTIEERVVKYTGLLDEFLSSVPVSSVLDGPNSVVKEFIGAGQVKVPVIEMDGLGDYDKDDGFVETGVNIGYETLTLPFDRAKAFGIDSQDDEETAFITSLGLMKKFMTRFVAPEVDAMRFAAYAAGAGGKAYGTLAANNVVAAVDAGQETLGQAGAADGAGILFLRWAVYNLLKEAKPRSFGTGEDPNGHFETYDGMRIRLVRDVCFTADAVKETSAGYTPGLNTVNFQIVHPDAVQQIKKHETLRVFAPAVNQKADKWLFQYRLYHGAFVLPDGLEDGIYSHTALEVSES